MSVISKLKPASKAEVMIYQPYYPKGKHDLLPLAISLYKKSSLEGERQIEGGENIPFVASWYTSKLPSDPTLCTVQFSGQADLSYEVGLPNSDLIKYLIYVIDNYNRYKITDFNQEFYRKLLRFQK